MTIDGTCLFIVGSEYPDEKCFYGSTHSQIAVPYLVGRVPSQGDKCFNDSTSDAFENPYPAANTLCDLFYVLAPC